VLQYNIKCFGLSLKTKKSNLSVLSLLLLLMMMMVMRKTIVVFLFLVEFVQLFYPVFQLDNQFLVEFDVLVVLLYVVDVVQYLHLLQNWYLISIINYRIVRVYIHIPIYKISINKSNENKMINLLLHVKLLLFLVVELFLRLLASFYICAWCKSFPILCYTACIAYNKEQKNTEKNDRFPFFFVVWGYNYRPYIH